ncbi:MAG: hypothetical protein C5B49_15495 [Bdellovibrio sp.]|nr:MAG: hypothetical protein C5B49_15495 [Bdellovibrio sp.]
MIEWESQQSPRFKSAILELLYEQNKIAFAAIIINGGLYAYLSWGIIDSTLIYFWVAANLLLTVIRYFLFLKWRAKGRNLSSLALDAALKQFNICVGISGILWGLIGIGCLRGDSPTYLAATTFLIAGMTSGAVGAYSSSLTTMYSFLFPSIIPFTLRLVLDNQLAHRIMGLICVAYIILMILIARSVNSRTLRGVGLGFENENLISRINDASHEIRTPVTAIAGAAELLADHPNLPPTALSYSKIILRNSLHLKKLVDNILVIATSGSKEHPQAMESVSLRDEITAVGSMMQSRLKEKGIQLETQFTAAVPAKVWTSSLKFQQILINLLSNAIKFSPQAGKISLSVDFVRPFLNIKVTDYGIGILPENIDRLFDPFFRENRAEVKSQEGSGLGLALARTLSRELGGDLKLLQSQADKGSTFLFSLRALPVEGDLPQPSQRLSGKKILLVDDAEDIRFLFRNRLEAEGAEVEVCQDGQAAVDLLAKNGDFDLILMDLNMPGLDGFLATKHIRKLGYDKPILAFTAYSSFTTMQKCQSYGFSDHIYKSTELNDIIMTLQKWLKPLPAA